MGILEIIGGVIVLITCVIIVFACLMQSPKQQDLGSAMTGSSNSDSFYGKNSGSSREAALIALTKILAVAFFVVTLCLNIIIPLFD